MVNAKSLAGHTAIANSFISTDERLSGAFTYDHYVRGLRKLIRWLAYDHNIGQIEDVCLDVNPASINPVLLLLGHSNRLNSRYRFIENLCKTFHGVSKPRDVDLIDCDYYQYLFRRYEHESRIGRLKGRRNCLAKVRRTLNLYEFYLRETGFAGFTDGVGCRRDFPLCFRVRGIEDLLELDGSHRRGVAYFCGARNIASIVVDIDDVSRWLTDNGSDHMYFARHWNIFRALIEDLQSNTNL